MKRLQWGVCFRCSVLAACVVGWSVLALVGCASDQKVIGDHNQQEAKERYGRQKNSMGSLNETPSEQAGQQHRDATQPVEREGREEENETEEE